MNKKHEFKFFLRILVETVWAAGLMAILTSCGTSPGYNYTISGTVGGMIGSGLVLQDNGGDDRTITANGAFSFVTALNDGTAYSVTVKTQPTNPSQTCVVSNGSGTITGSPVMNVAVSCVMNSSPVTVDPSGNFAYVSNSNTSNISAYTINQTTGALTSVSGTFTTGISPNQVTVDPSGTFAFVANMGGGTGDGTISAYTIDNTSTSTPGALNTVSGSPFTAGTSPSQVTVDPSGTFVYVANIGDGTISAYTIDNTSTSTPGALNAVSGSPFTAGTSPLSVTIYPYISGTFASSGEFAYVPNMNDNTISVYTINTDGSLTPSINTPTVGTGTYPTSFTIYTNSSGASFAYVPNLGDGTISLFTINSDGSLSGNGNAVTADTYPASVTIYPNSSGTYAYAYVSNMGSGNITAFAINPSDGTYNSYVTGSNFTTGTYPNPVTLYTNSSGDTFAYVSDRNDGNIWVYSIDGTSGVLTPFSNTPTATAGTSLTTVTIDLPAPPTRPNASAYVSDVNTGIVYAFIIGDDGTLTPVSVH
jgi:6-phosphogluconolactonase (cycloisomerase 2 family)